MKKLMSILIAVLVVFTITSCGDNNANGNDEQSGENLKIEKSAKEESKDVILEKKQVVKVEDKYEFNVDFSQITKKVMPPKPAEYYHYYDADEGKEYVDLCIAYKNLSTDVVMADDALSGKIQYAGKYDYNGFSIIEEKNRGSFTYSNITEIAPLTEEYVHLLFEIPEEAATSTEPIVASIVVGENTYKYNIR